MLSIKRPTATTVLYTVSTRSPAKTLSAQLTALLILLARVLAGLLVVTALLWEYQQTSSTQNAQRLSWLNNTAILFRSDLSRFLGSTLTQSWRLVIYAAVTWPIFRKGYTSESLLVIRGLGVQTSTSSPSYLWTSSTRFIPTSTIQDIFIHEAFKGFEVRFYLSIVVEGEEDVVVVFPVSTRAAELCIGGNCLLMFVARMYSQDVRFWKMYGEELGLVSMSRRHELP